MILRGADSRLLEKKKLLAVEIGVWEGIHAQEMLDNLSIKKLYLVDPYISYQTTDRVAPIEEMLPIKKKAEERLHQYRRRIIWLKKTSVEAVKDFESGSLDYVYVDARHRYRFAFQDITLWTPKVKIGGLIAGHDYDTPTVREAVEDYCQDNGIKFETDSLDWWFWKV